MSVFRFTLEPKRLRCELELGEARKKLRAARLRLKEANDRVVEHDARVNELTRRHREARLRLQTRLDVFAHSTLARSEMVYREDLRNAEIERLGLLGAVEQCQMREELVRKACDSKEGKLRELERLRDEQKKAHMLAREECEADADAESAESRWISGLGAEEGC
ncbi:MAG: hypothetical protein H6832_02885 [Planctomycetes bacterium]|nr:hypothetical protein [Planctomycetota bacterium]MCB9917327.1 hypothetical protein [Planctomycetota bacterium]